MSPLENTTRVARVVTPSGAPPFLLPVGDSVEEPPETELDNAGDAQAEATEGQALDLTSGTSGLLSSSDALSSAVSDKGAPAPATAAKARTPYKGVRRPSYKSPGRGPRPEKGALVPADHVIEQWCTDIRTWGRKSGGLYTADALCYWARYSFDGFSPEYKEVRTKIHAFLGDK